jgi:exonuclease VII small subunit
MFAIFRKRSGKLSAELEALKAKAADLVQRAEAHINGARQVINILSQEVDEAQKVSDTLQGMKNG